MVRLRDALGVSDADVPVDDDARWAWLGAHVARDPALLTAAGAPFDPVVVRLRDEAIRALAATDPHAARAMTEAIPDGPLEATLGLGLLARASALTAARADGAVHAILACAPLLARPLPIARRAMLTLAQLGLAEGALGRRARAVLEEALVAAIAAANELGATGMLAAQLDPSLAEIVMPGMAQRTAVATVRIVELLGALVALAPQREGLTARLSALAREVPPYVGPTYVVAFVTALGSPDTGPYLHEVRDRLARAAEDLELRVRAPALAALGAAAREDVTLHALLLAELLHGDASVRTAAALALGDVGAVPDDGAKELADMVELGDPEEALAAARALVACGRPVPLATIDDPLVAATAQLMVARTDDNFLALVIARTLVEDEVAFDERVDPETLLVETLRAMEPARVAGWIARFATGEVAAIGDVIMRAYDDHPVPAEVAAAAEALVDMLATAEEDHAALLAMIAARLRPEDARLEPLIDARTSGPARLIALASLSEVTDAAPVIAALDEPDLDHVALAIDALARISAPGPLVERLVGHLSDEDPLAEAAHATLLAWIDRGVI